MTNVKRQADNNAAVRLMQENLPVIRRIADWSSQDLAD